MRDHNPLFKIHRLSCSYQNNKEVLRIKDICIPKQKLVVLLGKSGSGKSTFLETLGLMNKTISHGDVLFYPENELEAISYSNLWNRQKLKDLAKIRHDYFSFIFQSTNLMPNFTAYENAYLTELIRGKPIRQAENDITKLFQELGLEEITSSRQASEMSGGQKQRIAFIRAVASTFSVLFGDEPTGNLDDFNSKELISFLRDNIKRNQRSAIIVSHNVNLSIEFGDVIMLLSEARNGLGYCELLSENIFTKGKDINSWTNHSNNKYHSDELSVKISTTLKEDANA